MSEKLSAYQINPDSLHCSYCEMVMEGIAPVSGKPRGLKTGHITICSNCGGVNILGDSDFKPMMPAEIAKLPEASRKLIQTSVDMVRSAIQRRPKQAPPETGENN